MKPIELNPKDFNLNTKQVIRNGHKPLNVLFIYANWCGHCIRFKPIYSLAATGVGSFINFYQFDEKKSEAVLTAYKVNSFPTILILDNQGKVIKEYKGPRDSEHSFISELCKMSLNCPRKYK